MKIPERLNLGPVSVAGVILPDSEPTRRLQSLPEPPTPHKDPPPGTRLSDYFNIFYILDGLFWDPIIPADIIPRSAMGKK